MAKDVVVMGASAGAVVIGPNIKVVKYFTPQMDTIHSADLTALNLTSKMIFPHYDREDLFPDPANRTIEDRLKEFESLEGCEVTRLKDEEWIIDAC
jgi:Peptidase E